jgi:hypothetical protein
MVRFKGIRISAKITGVADSEAVDIITVKWHDDNAMAVA